jgi:hypothetical protein
MIASYQIDTIGPTAPDQPTCPAGPFINEEEEAAGVEVQVSLGTSEAETGDGLELLLDGSSRSVLLTRVLTDSDITAGFHTFAVGAGQLGPDGDK